MRVLHVTLGGVALSGLLLTGLGGCPGAATNTVGGALEWMELTPEEGLNAGLARPEFESGRVRLIVMNESGLDAEVAVEMHVGVAQVHEALRLVGAGAGAAVIGPDRADTVRVGVTLRDTPPVVRPQRFFLLDQDFNDGDDLRVVIGPAPAPPGDDGSEQPQPLQVWLAGLEQDIRVARGMTVGFVVNVDGERSPSAALSVYIDQDEVAGTDDDLLLLDSVSALDVTIVQWQIPDIAPGRYRVFAEVRDGDQLERSAPVPGRIHVNAPPEISIDLRHAEQLVVRGLPVRVHWTAFDADDDAQVTFFLTEDPEADDGEAAAVLKVPAGMPSDLTVLLPTGAYAAGHYYVGGRIHDGLETAVAYAGPVEIISAPVEEPTDEDVRPGERVDPGTPY